MKKNRVGIIDDHPLVVDGLSGTISSSDNYELAWTGKSLQELLENLEKDVPDVLLLDNDLPDGSGIETTKKLIKLYPQLAIIIFTSYNKASFIKAALRNGAKSFLIKTCGKDEMIKAMDTVITGETYLGNELQKILMEDGLRLKSKTNIRITRREKEVLVLVADGLTNSVIAEKLFLSIKTVENHRNNLIHKMDVNNTAELVKKAMEQGLI